MTVGKKMSNVLIVWYALPSEVCTMKSYNATESVKRSTNACHVVDAVFVLVLVPASSFCTSFLASSHLIASFASVEIALPTITIQYNTIQFNTQLAEFCRKQRW
jgi:hypothetical protein